MIAVNFYRFSKRENSTARPTGNAVVWDCTLNDNSALLSPTIILALPNTYNTIQYNFAYIPYYDRYYFITEWTWSGGRWVASLEVDPLASWKDTIGASTQYVLRSSALSDGTVMDSFYPTKAGITIASTTAPPIWVKSLSQGSYVVGIINSDRGGVGGISYYVFSESQMNDLNNTLLGNADWLEIPPEEVSVELSKALFNPYQYITSCKWFPFDVPAGSAVSKLDFGWWTIPVSCQRISGSIYVDTFGIDIQKHPQSAARGEYLNLSPYSRYTLWVQPFGMIPIDSTSLIASNTLSCVVRVDLITGKATLVVAVDASIDKVVAMELSMVGVPIQLAQIARDYLGTASTALTTAAGTIGAFTMGNVVGGIAGIANGIDSTIRASLPQLMTSGSTGSTSDFWYQPRLQAQYFPLVDEDNEDRGRPLCQKKILNTLGGYIMVADADIALPASKQEIQLVKSYMIGGFFYE